MIECSGKPLCFATETVTGRLWNAGRGDGALTECAKIVFWNGESELTDTLLRTAVGVVFPSTLEDEKASYAARLAEFCRLPALCIDKGAIEGDGVYERIAILDARHGKLYVNPDLEVINAYFDTATRKKPRNICGVLEGDALGVEGADALFVGSSFPHTATESEAYEFFCDIADKNTGVSLVACADLSYGIDSFISRVRAIYRASVWGRYSMLCRGIHTEKDAEICVSLIHHVFCRLDSEGREFNGFIKKGMTVDTPIMLLSRGQAKLFDFFLLDIPRLRYLFTSSNVPEDGLESLVRYIEAFSKSVGKASIALRIDLDTPIPTLRELAAGIPISDLYSDVSTLRRVLPQL